MLSKLRTVNFIKNLKQKLKGLFTLTPEQLQHAEKELRFLFGIDDPSAKLTTHHKEIDDP